jgi:hypothetical protein
MGTVTPLPAPPPEAPVCPVCGGPARMALTVTAAGGRGYVHEQVWFDWRAAPPGQQPRYYCKAHGIRSLITLTDLYVAEDGPGDLDPQGEPADPNATARARLAGSPT